jgi:transposase InsO family protein
MIYALIKDHKDTFPIEVLCETLEVGTSGYYLWAKRQESQRKKRRAELAEKIRMVHAQNRKVYGSPRVHQELLALGEKVCRNTVAKVMKAHGIRAKTPRTFRVKTTDSDHPHPIAPNTLNREFKVETINTVWTTDITYIPTKQGWLYLAGVMDLCSRKIVGWSMGSTMETSLVRDALTMAIKARNPGPGLLHHSDRGVQYACREYREILDRHRMEASMSRTGNCYDNAPTESLWGTVKTEAVNEEQFETREQAKAVLFDYIEVFYNRRRRHSSLGYLSPEQFEAARH